MASIHPWQRKDGSTAHKVVWRERGRQHSMTFDEPAQAELLRDSLNASGNVLARAEQLAVSKVASGPTVADVMREHLRGLTGVEDRTRADYRRDAHLHIIPQLGELNAGLLSRQQVRDWVNDAATEGAAPKSISNWHGLLHGAMNTAIDMGLRADNPCKGVRLPQRDRRDDHQKFMELEHYKALVPFIPAHWLPLVEVLAGTGMRWGEATALRAVDLEGDEDGARLAIRQAWKKDGSGRPFLSTPKTSRSFREVSIDAGLRDLLLPLVGGSPRELLLRGPNGGPVNYTYFRSKVWSPAVSAALEAGAIPRPQTLHHLRHSHGSWLIAAGVSMKVVQHRLGHSSITTTMNIYGHVAARAERAAADAIGAALRG